MIVLNIILDIDPRLDQVPIPCMLLQPLMENAIIHGFELCPHKGVIRLSVRRKGLYLRCVVEDNGIGFNPKNMIAKNSGIGLNSVKNRLKYYFQENFEFHIESQPNKGTTVSLSFPIIGGNENEEY